MNCDIVYKDRKEGNIKTKETTGSSGKSHLKKRINGTSLNLVTTNSLSCFLKESIDKQRIQPTKHQCNVTCICRLFIYCIDSFQIQLAIFIPNPTKIIIRLFSSIQLNSPAGLFEENLQNHNPSRKQDMWKGGWVECLLLCRLALRKTKICIRLNI